MSHRQARPRQAARWHDWPLADGSVLRGLKELRDGVDMTEADRRADGIKVDRHLVRHNKLIIRLGHALGQEYMAPGRPEFRPDLAWLVLGSVDAIMTGTSTLARIRVDRLERAAEKVLLAVEDAAGCE